MSINPTVRHRQILDLARRHGKVTVEDLVARLNVTPQTIRKDLNDLGERGFLSRVHGGAVLGSGVENLEYEARRRISVMEKQAIGRAAAERIPDGASLFINIGTTTEEVAKALAGRSNLMVITNNLNVVDILCRNPAIDLIVVGGRVRRADRAAVGATAVDFIRNFKVDFAVIGASAIDKDGALLDYDLNEVQVSHAIVENSRQVILVADHTKLTRGAPVRIGHIGAVDIFVTDHLESKDLLAVCAEHGVEVVNSCGPCAKPDEDSIASG